ncbi:unnamed protein product [Oikopleura dioica]|uniref:Uncharacterized protein n=1 Tax=Oikopleura dioica TaxID=34765 RepID=E4XQB7_OIKDI|nr:unnamed protein product [Oikopleura dioica]
MHLYGPARFSISSRIHLREVGLTSTAAERSALDPYQILRHLLDLTALQSSRVFVGDFPAVEGVDMRRSAESRVVENMRYSGRSDESRRESIAARKDNARQASWSKSKVAKNFEPTVSRNKDQMMITKKTLMRSFL